MKYENLQEFQRISKDTFSSLEFKSKISEQFSEEDIKLIVEKTGKSS